MIHCFRAESQTPVAKDPVEIRLRRGSSGSHRHPTTARFKVRTPTSRSRSSPPGYLSVQMSGLDYLSLLAQTTAWVQCRATRPRAGVPSTEQGRGMDEVRARCHGCGAAVGERHDRVCDIARCRATGFQWHGCDHATPSPVPHEPDLWTGRWPGEEDCERLGWYAHLVPGQGWMPCRPDDPGAQADINRLYTDAIWDPRAERWIAISGRP